MLFDEIDCFVEMWVNLTALVVDGRDVVIVWYDVPRMTELVAFGATEYRFDRVS